MKRISALRLSILAAVAAASVAMSAVQLLASVILPDLPAGTQYQEIFFTNGTDGSIQATSSTPSDYDAFVTAQAAQSPSPIIADAIWHAVESTDSSPATTNAPSSGIPVYNTHGDLVAFSTIYLGTIGNAARYDQFGNVDPTGFYYVWTGSTATGGIMTGNAMGDLDPEQGRVSHTDGSWLAADNTTNPDSDAPIPNTTSFGMYALSGTITAVPEPATITLFAAALLSLGGIRLCRRQRHVS